MMRLVKRGLMFGNLFEVTSTALVTRYNRALEHLIGNTTTLTEFHLDISGYSPEIGDEFGDEFGDVNYLNPDGCNRQFILLSTEQKTAPLLNANFSMSRSILRSYIEAHEDELFALTTREVVVGELLNSVYVIEKPLDLFDIREIEVEADTITAHVAASDALSDKIFTFMEKPDAWWDDVLIADMIELSKKTGDIIRNPLKLDNKSYPQRNFHTAHFGGVYVFRDMDEPACIGAKPLAGKHELPVEYACTLDDRYDIAAFLNLNDLVEPIAELRSRHAESILNQKLDFIVIDVAAEAGDDLSALSRRDLRGLRRRHFKSLPDEYHVVDETLQQMLDNAPLPRVRPDQPAYFYLFRAKDHRDKALVNMLLSELTPLDFRQMFICHKEAFYTLYRTWGDQKRTYVAQFLADEYALDKAGTREELFGLEPSMALDDEPIDLGFGKGMGPWGAFPSAR